MDDKDFDVHVANEHRYRTKQEETLAANKTGIAPPAMQKAVDVAGKAVSALGSGVYDILNPVHKDEEGQIDWGKTGVHAAVEAPLALYLAGKGTGLVKKGYDSMVGVNPTIAAQNATKEITQQRQIEHDERMMAAKTKAAADLDAAKSQQQASKQTSPKVQQKTWSPQDQYLMDIYNKQQADKNFSGQPQQQSPTAANVGGPQNAVTPPTATKSTGHPLDSYVRTQAAKDGISNMTASELSRLSGMQLYDNADVQAAITKLRNERLTAQQFKSSIINPSVVNTTPLTAEQIAERQRLRGVPPLLPSGGGGGGAVVPRGGVGNVPGANDQYHSLNPLKL